MNKYELVKLLGKGSYGRVDLAKKKQTGELVAIKKIKFGTMTVQERKKSLEEATLLSTLHHPNIVGYHESFQERNSLYIVMEYIDWGDLEKKIEQRGMSHLPEKEVLFIFVQILLAIAYLHGKNILHRDIKPQNVFLTSSGIVKLGDFGVAKTLSSGMDLAMTVIGTPFYLAPEIWESRPYNTAADIWSLGALLYQLCCLKKPYDAKSPTELMVAVMRGNHAPLPESYSRDLRELVDGMLNRDPQLRPTAEQIKNRPFIRKAMQDLIDFNKTQLSTSPRQSGRLSGRMSGKMPGKPSGKAPARGGGRRLLEPLFARKPVKPSNPVQMQTIRDDDGPAWARGKETRKEVPTFGEGDDEPQEQEFEDDFIEEDVIEDDFIDYEEEELDEFHLLQDITSALEESILPTGNVSTWRYVPADPIGTIDANDLKAPKFARDDVSPVESLRIELESELGDAQLEELYRNIQNERNPKCRKYVRDFEKKNKKAVQDVRHLIYLEESM